MVTVQAINASIRRYWIAVYIAMLPGLALLVWNRPIGSWLLNSFEPSRSAGVFVLGGLLVLGLGLIFAAIFLMQKWYLLRCPHCGKFIYPNTSAIVVATKHCTKCGMRVIDAGS
jgi:hypothetical protein